MNLQDYNGASPVTIYGPSGITVIFMTAKVKRFTLTWGQSAA